MRLNPPSEENAAEALYSYVGYSEEHDAYGTLDAAFCVTSFFNYVRREVTTRKNSEGKKMIVKRIEEEIDQEDERTLYCFSSATSNRGKMPLEEVCRDDLLEFVDAFQNFLNDFMQQK